MLRDDGINWIGDILTTPRPATPESEISVPMTVGEELKWQLGVRLVRGVPRLFDLPFVDEAVMIEQAGLPPLADLDELN